MHSKLLILLAIVAVCNADTASTALNRFLRAQVNIGIKAYDDTSGIPPAWVAYFGHSLDNHNILKFFLKHSPASNQRLLTSLPIQIYLQRQINYKTNFLGSIASDYGNFEGLIRQWIGSTVSNIQDLIDYIENSQSLLAQLFGLGFDLLSNTNPWRSENQALMTFFNAHLANTKRFQTEIEELSTASSGGSYLDRYAEMCNTLRAVV